MASANANTVFITCDAHVLHMCVLHVTREAALAKLGTAKLNAKGWNT